MRVVFFWFLFSLSAFSIGQISDDFSDGNFNVTPSWSGDNGAFVVNNSEQLQLNSSGAATSYLSVANSCSLNEMEWQIWVKMSFSPSDNNNVRIYLASDQTNLKGALNGYFIRMGENGSFDSVDLWEQSGNSETKIINGVNSHCSGSTNTLRLKVTRDDSGNWTLYSDTLGGTDFQLEGTINNTTHPTTSFSGIYCKYTTSNATKFYFDDFYMGPIVIDSIPPSILNLNVLSDTELAIYFSEAVDKISSETPINYFVNNGIGNPTSAKKDSSNPALIHLSFSNPFPDGVYNLLTVSAVQDLSLNPIVLETDSFYYYVAKSYDIVINEIMADPDPPIGLPNYEYIELYNKSHLSVKLKNWKICIGSNTKLIPDVQLFPDSFLVLASPTGTLAFDSSVATVAITSFPALTNTGQTITLKSSTDAIISSVSYSNEWYNDENKQEGGWAIEQIDPDNPCAGISNWKASTDPKGGTPGRKNSVYQLNPDTSRPQIARINVISKDTLQVYFSESIDSSTSLNISAYTIDYGINSPVTVNPVEPDFKSVILTLGKPLQTDTIYTLSISNIITDCKGNLLGGENFVRFAIPEHVTIGDIIINELLPEPKTNGVEFVEIYNRSKKVLDLKNITLSSIDTITNQLTEIKNISIEGQLFFPNEYIVLSTNSSIIKSQYYTPNKNGFIDMVSLPVMNNEGDIMVVGDITGNIIDMITFNSSMHFPLLNETKGVSLERIDFNRATQDPTNWHSASENSGFATPAYQNSQYSKGEDKQSIKITPEVFSPDNDGYNDVVNINYAFDTPGMVGNIIIYDSKGRAIRHLVRNELLGIEGTFSWDGINDMKEKASIGIYVIFVEAFDIHGNIIHYKNTCVLGGKL